MEQESPSTVVRRMGFHATEGAQDAVRSFRRKRTREGRARSMSLVAAPGPVNTGPRGRAEATQAPLDPK